MTKEIIHTAQAPTAIGPYSQAIKAGNLVFLSGQLGINPATGELLNDFESQVRQAFRNLQAVAEAAGGSLADVVKFTLFLTDLQLFAQVNNIMSELVSQPYPARSTIGVASLPKNGAFEVEALLYLPNE